MRANPTAILRRIEKELCERSLLEFIQRGWHAIEPGGSFVAGWALAAICEHLEAVSRGEITRLLINVPPGCTKSMTVNVFWPAWEWGPRNAPHLRYISASHEGTLSTRDLVRCRDLVNSEWYQGLWGDRFDWKGDQNAKTLYENNHAGSRYAGSVGGSLIGRRGDRIIVDDPHNTQNVESDQVRKAAVRWFSETLPTRVNDQERSPIVVIMQRVHQGDISGHILSKELGYTHLCLPMEFERDHPHKSTRFVDPRTKDGELLWPERFTPKALDELKKTFRSFGGMYAETGQLQQRPAPRGGGMFQEKDFQYLERAPELRDIAATARGWDLAGTEDAAAAYSAGAKISRLVNGAIVVEDVLRGQWNPHKVYDNIEGAARRDGLRVKQSLPQDPGQAGKDQKRHLAAHLQGCNLHFSPESGSKADRAQPLAAQGQAGNLFLVRGPWNDAFVAEAMVFPNGEFLDQIDAASRAYAAVIGPRAPRLGAAPLLVTR